MTEEEAKTKRCCGPADCGHYNSKPYPARWCLGSECMAWRTIPLKPRRSTKLATEANAAVIEALRAGQLITAIKEHRSASGLPLKEAKDFCEALRAEMFPQPISPQGFCGLAGRTP